MTRFCVVVLTGLALLAGACSGSEPVASPPEAEPTVATVPTEVPEPTATPTPTPEPTATPAPTPTPAPSEEELAVVAAWQRYVVLTTVARSKDPTEESLDYTTYRVGSSLVRAEELAEEDREANQYLSGSTESLDPKVEFRDELTAVVEDCVRVKVDVRNQADDEVSESFDRVSAVRARLELTESGWLIAAQEDGTHSCDE